MRPKFSRLTPLVSGLAAVLLVGVGSASAQTAPSSGWTPGPDVAQGTGNTFSGFVDSPSTGATLPTSGALGNPYWTNSGFSITVPSASLPAGSDTLGVYLHTPGKGWWYAPLTLNASPTAQPLPAPGVSSTTATGAPQVTVTDPTEAQEISTRNGNHTIQGSVTSPGASASDIDRVEVWIDGERDSGTLLGSTTPQSDGSWSLTFTPTHYPSTHSNIYVYAHSKSTGKETEFIRGFNITDK